MIFPADLPVLKCDPLILKQIETKDLQELEEIVSYHPTRRESARSKLQRMEDMFTDQTSITWGIYLHNELIGTVGFYRGFENNTSEIGYVTREKFRRKGYTSTAIQCVVNYGLEKMKLAEIVAYTSDWNKASIKTLEKLYFEQVISDHEEYIKYKFNIQHASSTQHLI